jgi:carbon-monoxide dehydrogenase medium subunit
MIPSAFEYHSPRLLKDAIGLLSKLGDDAKVLAGGHSLLPLMKLRLAAPAHLVDLNRIDELRGIREDGGTLRIGAMTTENDLIASPLLAQKCPLLPEAARQIADPQVRNRGTLGGDIAHGDPGNDHPAISLALDASFVLAGPAGERTVPADGFFVAIFTTQLAAGEILKEIRVPSFAAGTGYAYCKLKRKTGDFATAATAVVLRMKGGVVEKVTIGLTNLAPTAIRAKAAEQLLAGKALDDAQIEKAAQAAMAICDPAEDLRGDREYKLHMAAEMTRRALRLARSRAH